MMTPTRTHLWRDYEEVRFSIKVESIIHYKTKNLDTKKRTLQARRSFFSDGSLLRDTDKSQHKIRSLHAYNL